ncbi:MCP four helix bundle domain-containing protein [Flavobacterium sp. W22_SRS_FK3]|uniref:MCP four helix bundle domain-containing protein n=1 Tax=Flavobacterium sp. W22_SRS_FK3 TaxID=3240275 RepID=UPI003F932F9C
MKKFLRKYSNKTKAAFILLIVMLIIVLSNFNTLRNSKNVNDNINTIYNDRLVVAYYIFQYANELHFIKAEVQKTDLNDIEKNSKIKKALKIIHTIDELYVKTVLTPKEKTHFNIFLATCSKINQEAQNKNWSSIISLSNKALKTLNQLSEIQVKEGRAKLANANAMYSGNNSLGQLEIALLIVLGGITFYLLIIKKPKRNINIPESPSLN